MTNASADATWYRMFCGTLQVLDSCLGMGVPVAAYVGGGYHADLEVLARRHCWLHRAAAQMWEEHGL